GGCLTTSSVSRVTGCRSFSISSPLRSDTGRARSRSASGSSGSAFRRSSLAQKPPSRGKWTVARLTASTVPPWRPRKSLSQALPPRAGRQRLAAGRGADDAVSVMADEVPALPVVGADVEGGGDAGQSQREVVGADGAVVQVEDVAGRRLRLAGLAADEHLVID